MPTAILLHSLIDRTSHINHLAIMVTTYLGQQLDSFGVVTEGFSEVVTFELDLEV